MALRFFIIVGIIVGIIVFKETRPKKVVSTVKKARVAPAPVEPEKPVEPVVVVEEKEPEETQPAPEVQPVVTNTPVPAPQVTPEPVVAEVIPEPVQPSLPIEKPAIPKVTFTPFKKGEVLSAEDKIIDLKETLPNIRTDLEELYKDKKLGSRYTLDKVSDLTIDAVQYLSNPEEFEKQSSKEVIKNTKEFLQNVTDIRKKYEVSR